MGLACFARLGIWPASCPSNAFGSAAQASAPSAPNFKKSLRSMLMSSPSSSGCDCVRRIIIAALRRDVSVHSSFAALPRRWAVSSRARAASSFLGVYFLRPAAMLNAISSDTPVEPSPQGEGHHRMKIKAALLALMLLAVNCLALARDAGAEGAKDQPIAFVGVNVVPMDSERVIENQTVIVRGDRIAELGPSAKVKVPAGALRIEAKGKYLMPGLAEMHG